MSFLSGKSGSKPTSTLSSMKVLQAKQLPPMIDPRDVGRLLPDADLPTFNDTKCVSIVPQSIGGGNRSLVGVMVRQIQDPSDPHGAKALFEFNASYTDLKQAGGFDDVLQRLTNIYDNNYVKNGRGGQASKAEKVAVPVQAQPPVQRPASELSAGVSAPPPAKTQPATATTRHVDPLWQKLNTPV